MTAITVKALDHVNIITPRLDDTANFFRDVLDLDRRDPAPHLDAQRIQWMYDANDRAIFHLMSGATEGSETGPIHHVALECVGYEAMCDRLDQLKLAFRTNHAPESGGLRQIFVRDPNGILLELNYRTGI